MVITSIVVGTAVLVCLLRRTRRKQRIEVNRLKIYRVQEELAVLVEEGKISPYDPIVITLGDLIVTSTACTKALEKFFFPVRAYVRIAQGEGMSARIQFLAENVKNAHPEIREVAGRYFVVMKELMRHSTFWLGLYIAIREYLDVLDVLDSIGQFLEQAKGGRYGRKADETRATT